MSKPSHSLRAAILVFLWPALPQMSRGEGEWNPDASFPALTPEEEIKTIEVPGGSRLECVASEPMVEEPASMAFDGNGSLYVCEWRTYMQDEHATGQLNPVSRVVKLTDTDGDGKMDKRTVFIDNIILPRAVLPMHDRVLVYFTESQTIWAYFDDDKNGVSDRREVAWQGGEDHGNIEHQQSGMLWNLDNTICTNDRRLVWNGGKLQALPHDRGRVSQHGLARDDDGRLVCSWGGGANPAHSFQLPAGYPILDLREHDADYERPWGICPVWDFSDVGYDVKRQAQLTNFSATCGQTVLRSPLFPQWYGNAVTCEPVGRLIRMSRFTWQDGMGTAHNAFPGSEFIRGKDAYFRPVWTESGPDGGLYIADLYRGIIQEKEWFPTAVTPELRARYVEDYRKNKLELWVERYQRVKRWGMLKVFRHGRILRLLPDGGKAGPAPHMLDETPAQLVAHLANPNGWWRDTAQMLIVSRGDKSAVPALLEMTKHADTNARLHSLWALRGLDALTKETLLAALKDREPRVRRAAVQLAETWLVQKDPETTAALKPMAADTDARTATQVFLAFRTAGQPGEFNPGNRPLPLVSAIQNRDRDEASRAPLTEIARRGKLVYENLCITCHGVDGMGVKAADTMLAPPLASSPWFAGDSGDARLVRILLKGQSGPINGITYGAGLMPPLEKSHTNEQIADVLTYAGERWHRWKRAVTAENVERIRHEISTRQIPWTHEELKALK
ncbi:MAG TPA: HEAT repeat domain-containing protein [Verrucomicrobiales bacterium]|nr:HEAT repeat domain-containing protein [Verrucomicrobiales bacterium]